MPVFIERIINEIAPEGSARAESEEQDERWRKRQELLALRDEQRYLESRLCAEEFDD
jgi:hypothetical protein